MHPKLNTRCRAAAGTSAAASTSVGGTPRKRTPDSGRAETSFGAMPQDEPTIPVARAVHEANQSETGPSGATPPPVQHGLREDPVEGQGFGVTAGLECA